MNFVASSKQDIEQEQRRKQDKIRLDVRRMIEDQMKKRFSSLKIFFNYSHILIIRLIFIIPDYSLAVGSLIVSQLLPFMNKGYRRGLHFAHLII